MARRQFLPAGAPAVPAETHSRSAMPMLAGFCLIKSLSSSGVMLLVLLSERDASSGFSESTSIGTGSGFFFRSEAELAVIEVVHGATSVLARGRARGAGRNPFAECDADVGGFLFDQIVEQLGRDVARVAERARRVVRLEREHLDRHRLRLLL